MKVILSLEKTINILMEHETHGAILSPCSFLTWPLFFPVSSPLLLLPRWLKGWGRARGGGEPK